MDLRFWQFKFPIFLFKILIVDIKKSMEFGDCDRDFDDQEAYAIRHVLEETQQEAEAT